MKQYYIVSLKHTSKGDTALTFWGFDGCGYTWHKKRAGLYNEGLVHLSTSDDNVAVLKEDVDKFWMNGLDFSDEYISVPNTPTVRHNLGLSERFMKPKKYAGCRINFINTPVNEPA